MNATNTIGLIALIAIGAYVVYGTRLSCDTIFKHNYVWENENINGNKISYNKCTKCGDEQGHHYYGYSEPVKYEIYSVTAPFGILYGNIHGSVHGSSSGFIFHSGSLSGSISTDLKEAYIVKYMVGNKLKTIKFDSEEVALIVDGELYLERHSKARFEKNEQGEWIEKPYPWVQYKNELYSIHIPRLPEIESSLTVDYLGATN